MKNNSQTFFKSSKMPKCACGEKAVAHGHCQKCWDERGKEKYLQEAHRLGATSLEKTKGRSVLSRLKSGCLF